MSFNLSYKDLEVNLSDYFQGEESIGFAVHSPELFSGDHILDLASFNSNYREHSISELSRVIEIAHSLKQYFLKTAKPVIVLNAGGWSKSGFISIEQKAQKYQLVAESLNQMNLDGVQIAIQTMPPFPWHFGGQSYHNIFVDPKEIAEFCNQNPKIKVCLDLSHAQMACNYYGWSLSEYIEKIAPYNIHMHISDARGSDGEGVAMGKGDIDFPSFISQINSLCPKVPFIPEIWQGHKNNGEGFWCALEFLENKMFS